MNKFNSIWGTEDPATLDLIKNTKISGRWLDLAAGDGRYAEKLLEKVDLLVAADIDVEYLEKLRSKMPSKYQKKLLTTAFDFLKPFPFPDDFFDGLFCTGALHLFKADQISEIINEVDRLLKKKGTLIFDFATDIKRIQADGSLQQHPERIEYTLDQAKILVANWLKDYKYDIIESEVVDQPVDLGDRQYKLNCQFLLVKAIKNVK